MDAITMLPTAVALFALAAAGGLLMAGIYPFASRTPPAWMAMLHGLRSGEGSPADAALAVGVPSPADWALLLLVVAAGAAMNLLWQWRQRPLPVGIMIGRWRAVEGPSRRDLLE